MRTSSYTIYVSLPDKDTEMLLVHGYTGAYDKVSRPVAEYLMALEAGPPPKPLYGEWELEPAGHGPQDVQRPADETMMQLQRRGYLTAMSLEEEEGYVARTAKKIQARALAHVPSYLFMPTYNCNLRCGYCFQDHMRKDPAFAHLLRTMTPELVDKVFAAMPALERLHGFEPEQVPGRNIGFYGGEPLLAQNRPIVSYTMGKARSLGRVSFWAVSNATELDAYVGLLGPDGIRRIQITLDGPPEEHDKRRIHADGSGSFARIADNIDLCLSLGVQVSVRMNMDRNNIEHVPRLADEIVARGWHEHTNFGIYTARIVPGNDTMSIASVFPTTFELDKAIDDLRLIHPNMRIIGRPDDGLEVRARRIFDTRANGFGQFKSSFCGAHTGMYIFDLFGDIYSCWERTGDARIRVGRVLDDGEVEIHEGMLKLWQSRTPASNPTCRKCRYAFHCGGGCAVRAEQQKGKFFTNYCDGFADRFRHSVAEAYLDHVHGAEMTSDVRVCDL